MQVVIITAIIGGVLLGFGYYNYERNVLPDDNSFMILGKFVLYLVLPLEIIVLFVRFVWNS